MGTFAWAFLMWVLAVVVVLVFWWEVQYRVTRLKFKDGLLGRKVYVQACLVDKPVCIQRDWKLREAQYNPARREPCLQLGKVLNWYGGLRRGVIAVWLFDSETNKPLPGENVVFARIEDVGRVVDLPDAPGDKSPRPPRFVFMMPGHDPEVYRSGRLPIRGEAVPASGIAIDAPLPPADFVVRVRQFIRENEDDAGIHSAS